MLGVSLWLLLIDNGSFWRLLWSARDQGSARAALALLALGAVLRCLLAIVLRLLCWGKLTKTVLISVLFVVALVAHAIPAQL